MGKMSNEEYMVDARQTFLALVEISNLLKTGLDVETLTYCVRLCESGIHPLTLANVVKELKREVELLKQQKRDSSFEKGSKETLGN